MFIAQEQLGDFCLSHFANRGPLVVMNIIWLFSENLLQIFSYSPFLQLSHDFDINPLPLHWSFMLCHFWSCKLYFADSNLFVWSKIQGLCSTCLLIFGARKSTDLLSHILKVHPNVYCTKTTGWFLPFTFFKERPPGGHIYIFLPL